MALGTIVVQMTADSVGLATAHARNLANVIGMPSGSDLGSR
eukprot:SAG11_NODE_182_length_13233_cov_59.525238_1_plen_41_part_00